MAGAEYTYASPTSVLPFTAQWQTRVRIGLAEHYAALSQTGTSYAAAYDWASIGLQAGQAKDLGILGSPPSIENTTTYEEEEAGNVKNSGIYALTEESVVCTIPVKQWDPDVIELAMSNGVRYTLNSTENLFTFGGACSLKNRPLEISAYNVGCNAPTAQDNSVGVQGWVLTLYGGYISSGWNIGELPPTETHTVELEYTSVPWLARALGNQFGNLYTY